MEGGEDEEENIRKLAHQTNKRFTKCNEILMNKKTKISTPNWSNVPYDLLELVLTRLSFGDKLRVQRVCSSWRSIAKNHILSLAQFPLLMLPTNKRYGLIDFDGSHDFSDYKNQCNSEDSMDCCLFKIDNKKFKKVKSLPKEIGQCLCVGSSQGWLLFLHTNLKDRRYYYIFNPFFDFCIKLCSLEKLRDISKSILWSDPIESGPKFAIVVLQDFGTKIAYAKYGDSEWSFLKVENSPYADIISFKDLIYALGIGCSIEAWDFSTHKRTKKISINPFLSQEVIIEIEGIPADFNTRMNRYLVRSQDQILMVVRYMESFIQYEDDGVRRYAIPSYETKKFHVYQLNKNEDRWAKLDSLGDMVLILGRNHSDSIAAKNLQGYEKNSIYFTHYKCCYYDTHDMGHFSLETGLIEMFIGDKKWRVAPEPFWVVPHV